MCGLDLHTRRVLIATRNVNETLHLLVPKLHFYEIDKLMRNIFSVKVFSNFPLRFSENIIEIYFLQTLIWWIRVVSLLKRIYKIPTAIISLQQTS